MNGWIDGAGESGQTASQNINRPAATAAVVCVHTHLPFCSASGGRMWPKLRVYLRTRRAMKHGVSPPRV